MEQKIDFEIGKRYYIDEKIFDKKHVVTLKHFNEKYKIFAIVVNDDGHEWETMLNRLTEIPIEKDLEYWRKNAEEDYVTTPISVLAYITELEKELKPDNSDRIFRKYGKPFTSGRHIWEWLKANCDIKIRKS